MPNVLAMLDIEFLETLNFLAKSIIGIDQTNFCKSSFEEQLMEANVNLFIFLKKKNQLVYLLILTKSLIFFYLFFLSFSYI